MKNGRFKQAITFNLIEIPDFISNAIVVKKEYGRKHMSIEALAFDFGKVHSYKYSPFSRFIDLVEGKTEEVIHNNSTFMHEGDSNSIPAITASSFEGNQRFKMICTIINSN